VQQNLGFVGNAKKDELVNSLNQKKVNFRFLNGPSDPAVTSSKKVSPILI
jgi:hypothetical protein